jgi:hypothetical protein
MNTPEAKDALNKMHSQALQMQTLVQGYETIATLKFKGIAPGPRAYPAGNGFL